MTIGNKMLMTYGNELLTKQKHLVLLLQNLIAVLALGVLAALKIVAVSPIDRKQMLFFTWDALVLVLQTWTAFEALQHLPVSATTVVRALAIPLVAWTERLVLGTRLDLAHHVCSWAVVGGAICYTFEDLAQHTTSATYYAGYLWCGANLLAYVSNSVLDRVMMSESKQTASGLSLITQALSLPICWAQGALMSGLTTSSAVTVLRSLDTTTAIALLTTGLCAGALGNFFAQCYKRASATAVTMMGNVNKALSVVASVLLFGSSLSGLQVAGLTVCLGGACGYSLIGAKTRDAAAGMVAKGAGAAKRKQSRRVAR